MSALRSLLRGFNPLITSLLRSVGRHVQTHTVALVRKLIAASRRCFSASDAMSGDPNQPAAAKRHLYLVLDDQKSDYGIYKLDVDADLPAGDIGSDSTTAPGSLPHPALIRMEPTEVRKDSPSTQFAAAGGCIVATGRSPYRDLFHPDDYGIVTILYDIKTAALSFSMHPTMSLQYGYVVAEPVGNRLYLFDSQTCSADSFHWMTTRYDQDADDGEVKQRWCYSSGRTYRSEVLLFSTEEIQAHAVHPRDRTIFLSAPVYDIYDELPSGEWGDGDVGTFVYHTTGDNRKWTLYGRWALPFKGHAHYDQQLNMWVGLQVNEDGDGTTGYLCACDLPSTDHDDEDNPLEPNWVQSMDTILTDDPDQKRIDFKLMYMGERGEYCLFERLLLEGGDEKECLREGHDCLLLLTTFRLKNGCREPHDDYLMITDRRARSYKVPRYRKDFEAQAFWI